MEVREYCRKMDAELTGWKVKLYNIISRMDQLSAENRENMYEKVNSVLKLMNDLNCSLKNLQLQPPRKWRDNDQKIRDKMAELREKYASTEKALNDCVH